jgi:sugar-specific transcriptional regulator TrmB
MIVSKELLGKLREFGLNSYESKLWTALLSRGVSTAGELSDISNVPRSRAYDVLESLEKKGFIIVKIGKPIKYLAVTPREVVERVKKRVQEDAEHKTNLLESLKGSPVLEELQ